MFTAAAATKTLLAGRPASASAAAAALAAARAFSTTKATAAKVRSAVSVQSINVLLGDDGRIPCGSLGVCPVLQQ